MDMREATITAIVAARESRYEPLLCADASNPTLRAAELALRWAKCVFGEFASCHMPGSGNPIRH
jgi:hypothetical protein